MIEGGQNDLICKSILTDQCDDLLFHALIPHDTVFQLNISDQICTLDQLKLLSESWDPAKTIFWKRLGGIDLPQLRQCALPDRTRSGGGTI